jgi:glutamyl-tRNA synthetase
MTLLNSNYEEWRMQNPDKHYTEFPFNIKKMSVSGCLFDFDKLNDVSKNVISKMSADEVYEQSLEWAKNNDEALAKALDADADYAKSIFAIGRGGKKPRKDLTTWADVKPYVDLFYDELFEIRDAYPEQFDKADIKKALESFVAGYDAADDMNIWFDKIKAIAESLGFASDMKAYKADPTAFKGNVADISMFIRVALTGKFNAPDMYTVMQILGYDRVCERIKNMIASL